MQFKKKIEQWKYIHHYVQTFTNESKFGIK